MLAFSPLHKHFGSCSWVRNRRYFADGISCNRRQEAGCRHISIKSDKKASSIRYYGVQYNTQCKTPELTRLEVFNRVASHCRNKKWELGERWVGWHFVLNIFLIFKDYRVLILEFHTGKPISFIPQENEKMEFSQPEWDRGVSLPGTFKPDHWQPFKPILFWNFPNFWLSYWGAHFLYFPGKLENGILSIWVG